MVKSINPACNCRIKTKYPLKGKCLQPSVIYQATTKSKDNLEKLHRTNIKTLETKELLTQIVIHQEEIHTQHSTIKIFVESKIRQPRNITENQEICTSLQKQLKTMYSSFRRKNGDHHLPRTTETFE